MFDHAASDETRQAHARRALIVADAAGLSLQQRLMTSGYVTRATTTADAERAIKEFVPDVIFMVITHHAESEAEHEAVALARKLRAEVATYSLPLVFAWDEDSRALHTAAQYIGVDDYFSLQTSTNEILARLDSLFWRVEAGRRSVPVVSDQRLEIDNFMFMLDAVREDARAHLAGTLALIYAVSVRGKAEPLDKAVRDVTLAKAHGFFKLNLRRVDAVAYYGPTALLVYLPRLDSRSATAALSRLHREFMQEHRDRDIVAGLASFPANGTDVEGLIEKAEVAVTSARQASTAKHVVAFEVALKAAAPISPTPEALGLTSPSETPVAVPSPTPALSLGVGQVEEPPRESAAETFTPVPAKRSEARFNAVAAMSAEEAAHAAEEAAARELDRRARGAVMPRRLLLAVSDSARMTRLNSLIRSAGYEARAAFDGQQALLLIRTERPDLLLLDYELQGIDGVETIRRLKKQGGGRLTLPVIMLLSNDNETALREALELGAHSVHLTPYDPAELLASVRRAGSGQ